MDEIDEQPTETPVAGSPQGIGARLSAAREARGLSVEDVADHTKISERHLASIETDDFEALPGRTYIVGFVRSYARMVGLDEDEAVETVRSQMNLASPAPPRRTLERMEPGDPARVPSAKLAWGIGALMVILLVAGFLLLRDWFMPAAELPAIEADPAAATPSPGVADADAQPAATPTGDVTFTATADRVWVKFYDAGGAQLMQKEMARGETYTVPADANGPQLWTGRPDALTITIGGRQVAPLADGERIVRDVPVDAASLTSRGPGPGLPSPGA